MVEGTRAQVFVKISEYKDILDILELIKNRMHEAKVTLGNLNELKKEEDSELEMWNSTINELEKKIENIDSSLLEPEVDGD